MAIDITFREWIAGHVGTKREPKVPIPEQIAIAGPCGETAYYSVMALSLDAVRMTMDMTTAAGYIVPGALPDIPNAVVFFAPDIEAFLEIKLFFSSNVRNLQTTGVEAFDAQIKQLVISGEFPFVYTFIQRVRMTLRGLTEAELSTVNNCVDTASAALVDLGSLHDAELYLPLKTKTGVPAWLVVPVDARWYLAVRFTPTGLRVIYTEKHLPGVRLTEAIRLTIGD